jgi:hypothetical protein
VQARYRAATHRLDRLDVEGRGRDKVIAAMRDVSDELGLSRDAGGGAADIIQSRFDRGRVTYGSG